MDLTEAILTELRDTSGISKNVINDTSLERLWQRLDELNSELTEPYGQVVLIEAALAKMFERVLNNATRLHDYKMGTHHSSMSQVYRQLKDSFERYKPALEKISPETVTFSAPAFGEVRPYRTSGSKPLPGDREW